VRAWLEGDWNAAPEGGVLKPKWLTRYDRAPEPPERYMVVHSWDTAYKAGAHNDPSCCTVWGITPTGYYLLDCYVEKLDYPTLRRKVVDMADRDNPDVVLIEDKASGQSLIQEIQATTQIPIKAINPVGDKVTRALAVSDLIEAGKVHVPERAPWLLNYELELTVFPTKDAHDDQVDSTTQFLSWAKDHATRRAEIMTSGEKRIGAGYTTTSGRGFGTIRNRPDIEGF